MSVAVRLPKELHRLYRLPYPVEVEGAATVADVISALDSQARGVGHRLADAGRLRRHVIVFVGTSQAGLADAVPDGGDVTVVTAVAGGAVTGARRPSSSP